MRARRGAYAVALAAVVCPGEVSVAFTPSAIFGAAVSHCCCGASSRRSLEHGRAASSRGRRTVTMGIPKLFRWLTDQYPAINQKINDGFNTETAPIDNFYLDMNGIIHMATHNNADSFIELNEEEMFKRIFIYTDRLYKLVAPTRLMFLAVDGVAPRAKMNQQRSRRFRSAKEAEQTLAELVAREGALPEGDRFDSNCITPGTDFMYNLGRAFREWIATKIEEDPFWRDGARIVFSGPDVPGEGEHKVMDYIRSARETEPDWKPDLRHCLYGLDADLIMLSLVTHEPHFNLLREKMSVRHSRRRRPKDPIHYTRDDFELLRVSMLREMLRLQFRAEASGAAPLPFPFSLERVIDDFVFMCMFVGNDFLPNMPHLDIADGALNTMLSIYRDMLPALGGYLTKKDEIHRGRLELFLHEVARREPLYFRQRGIEESDAALQSPDTYRERYYESKLGLRADDAAARRALVTHYIEGLYWVLQYYHRGVDSSSWSWYYPHLYAPLGSDLKDLAALDIKFNRGRPFPPLMQLLSVLPGASAPFLPKPYQELMVGEQSPILHFYPQDFECDANGKRQSWETVVKIPFIEESELIEALESIDHKADLEVRERIRNSAGKVWEYRPVGEGTGAARRARGERGPEQEQGGGYRARGGHGGGGRVRSTLSRPPRREADARQQQRSGGASQQKAAE
ncbi:dhm exonuclease [Tribonema minus]|uniref:5'-3' exoribonuclease n=1 Tax=Tribonema minus TaxID=303371 RepID=A0A835ZEW4_9STRA|nr:dhm exonuclease [Tribonema minus]